MPTPIWSYSAHSSDSSQSIPIRPAYVTQVHVNNDYAAVVIPPADMYHSTNSEKTLVQIFANEDLLSKVSREFGSLSNMSNK